MLTGLLATAIAAVGLIQPGDAGRAQAAATAGLGQGLADSLVSITGADAAFVPVGLLKPGAEEGAISASLVFPGDDIQVVSLTGAQVRQALERSVSLLPSKNPAFLHLAGLEATASLSAAPEKRVAVVTINGAALEDAKTYKVAMPGNLARGGLGYFMVWEASAISTPASGKRMSEAAGSASASEGLRWTFAP